MVKNIIPKLGMSSLVTVLHMSSQGKKMDFFADLSFPVSPFLAGFSSSHDCSCLPPQLCVLKSWLSTLTSSRWSHFSG